MNNQHQRKMREAGEPTITKTCIEGTVPPSFSIIIIMSTSKLKLGPGVQDYVPGIPECGHQKKIFSQKSGNSGRLGKLIFAGFSWRKNEGPNFRLDSSPFPFGFGFCWGGIESWCDIPVGLRADSVWKSCDNLPANKVSSVQRDRRNFPRVWRPVSLRQLGHRWWENTFSGITVDDAFFVSANGAQYLAALEDITLMIDKRTVLSFFSLTSQCSTVYFHQWLLLWQWN